MGTARADLHQRQLERWPRVEARIDAARPAPVLTIDELAALVGQAQGETVAIAVHRARRLPKRGQPIRLPIEIDGVTSWTMLSSEDKDVERIGGNNFLAHWRVADLRLLIDRAQRKRKPK